MFDPRTTKGLSATFELRVGAERFQARIDSGQLEVVWGGIRQADAVLEGDVATLRGLIFAGEPVDQALRSGKLSLSGNEGLVRWFLGLFKLPEPFEPAESARSA
jgi:ubiquinone biosynthesis protein UbiJ